MNEIPKISVIIPIYNQEKYLRYCLESVLLQNLQEIEVICVNDGSTDGSFNILSELAWTDERLKIINQENKGVGEARNTGIREAEGEYVAFIDPDDKYYNFKALELLYNKAKENDALICGGCFSRNYEDRGEENEFKGSAARYTFSEDRFYTYREYQYDYGFHRFIYDRKLILDNEQFFPSLKRFQDPVWFVKLLHRAGRFYGVSEIVYSYRKGHKENIFKDKEKVCHNITGLTEAAKVAVDNGYDHLLELEKIRIIREYSEHIYPFICDKDEDINRLLCEFEEVTGFKNIETDILANIVGKRDARLAKVTKELERLKEENEKYRTENAALKEVLDAQNTELKQINVNMDMMLEEMKLQKTIIKKESDNILPYPYVNTTHEKDGIKWTDLGDGRVEATGTAEEDTKFVLTPPLNKTDFKTDNGRYAVSTGADNTSSFTWFISGGVGSKKDGELIRRSIGKVTINDTDCFSKNFEIDTSGYDYFTGLSLMVKKGRTLDHVIFKPEIIPID